MNGFEEYGERWRATPALWATEIRETVNYARRVFGPSTPESRERERQFLQYLALRLALDEYTGEADRADETGDR